MDLTRQTEFVCTAKDGYLRIEEVCFEWQFGTVILESNLRRENLVSGLEVQMLACDDLEGSGTRLTGVE